MAETNNTDKLIVDFLKSHKKEVHDDGFTHRVMRRLPHTEKERKIGYLTPVALVLSAILFVALGGAKMMWETLKINLIDMIYDGSAQMLDWRTTAIVTVVLLYLGTRKICSLN